MLAVNKHAMVPPSKAYMPSLLNKPFRFGASAPIPPICIPMEAKFENPHKMYELMMMDF